MGAQLTVHEYWEKLAKSKPSRGLITHGDINQVALETDAVLSFLSGDDNVLDVGCGTGFSTFAYANKCKEIVGIDYSISMIRSAKEEYNLGNLRFEHLDVLSLSQKYGQFSTVISTRCLINLKSWDEQKDALRRIHSCLMPEGNLILVEGSQQGRAVLNKLRRSVGLSAMPQVWHNNDFDEDKLIPFLFELFSLEENLRFGLYDILMRVYYPLSISPKEPQYGTLSHKAAYRLVKTLNDNAYPECSREFLMVLKKL